MNNLIKKIFLFGLILFSFGVHAQEMADITKIEGTSIELDTIRNSFSTFRDVEPCIIDPDTGDCIDSGDPIIIDPSSPIIEVQSAGRVPDNLSFTETGAVNYSVPFDLPPGIGDFTPNLAITFNSQGGNGLAGFGWNISGLSSISRVPSTLYHNDMIDGVDFDLNDHFSLDGQRLILKTSLVGGVGGEYRTENYSNLKVEAFGTSPYGSSYGPSYFVVYNPDGSYSYYGDGDSSRSRLQWALHKTVDAQGNYVKYSYIYSGNTIKIGKIEYGANGDASSPNEIIFNYKDKSRPEVYYINGIHFYNRSILESVVINANGNQFRKYLFTHNQTSLGYDRLQLIKVYNEDNNALPPITFNYNESGNEITPELKTSTGGSLIYPGVDKRYTKMASGDYNGDGDLDFLLYRKGGTSFSVFPMIGEFDPVNIGYEVGSSDKINKIFSSSILSHNGKVLQNTGMTVVSERVEGNSSVVKFNTAAIAASSVVWQYSKEYNFNLGSQGVMYCGDIPETNDHLIIPKEYLSGDFNGDGLTDVLVIEKRYLEKNCEEEPDPYDYENQTSCYCHDVADNSINENNSPVYFVDLKRDSPNNVVTNLGSLSKRISSEDKLYAADFNGDGKTDLIHIADGIIRVYEIDNSNSLSLVTTKSTSYIDVEKPILFGDFNGDSKSDIVIPKENGSTTWMFFMSRGNSIYFYSKNIGIEYKKDDINQNNGINVNGVSMNNPYFEYHYIPHDYNGDGKTDIIYHRVVTPYGQWDKSSSTLAYYDNILESGSSTPSFNMSQSTIDNNNGMVGYGVPAFLDTHASNSTSQYAYISGNKIHSYNFSASHSIDKSLNKIVNDGLTTTFDYGNIVSNYGGYGSWYQQDLDETYPYVNLNVAKSLYVLKEVNRSSTDVEQHKQFFYSGLVAHIKGLGMLGFKSFHQTNWYGDGVAMIWTSKKKNMQLRGATTAEWSSLGFYLTPPNSGFIGKTTYSYNTEINNGIFINEPTDIVVEDNLKGITTQESYTYDAYHNPETIHTVFPGGETTVHYTYYNNIFGTPLTSYYIGRLKQKTGTSVLGGNSFETITEYSYSNDLPIQKRIKSNNSDWLTNIFTYDEYGNMLSKTVQGTGIVDRTESFLYDSSGRFMIKSIDVDGLESIFTYDNNNGNLVSKTNPYGLITSYEYDGWGRRTKTTDYLGNETTYTYTKQLLTGIGFAYKGVTNYPEGKDLITYTNKFGWEVRKQELDLNEKWIVNDFEYDAAGRVVRQSDAYFSGSEPSLWTKYYYDTYGRLYSSISITGQTVNTTFNGLTTTSDDGVKTVSVTKDGIGNVLSVTDEGGTINYEYYGNGTMKTANYGSHIVSTEIDEWGRKESLSDPAAGTYTYSYNILGELLESTTPNGSTSFEYDDFGKITFKEITGSNTDLSIQYNYNQNTKLLSSLNCTDLESQRYYDIQYAYDDYKRMSSISELRDDAEFEKTIQYDGLGRVKNEKYTAEHLSSGLFSNVKIDRLYESSSGVLISLKDEITGNVLYSLTESTKRGKIEEANYGNGIAIENTYDDYGYLIDINESDDQVEALKLHYTYNTQRGLLTSRKNAAFENWQENFEYDNLDRLTEISGAVTHIQTYDDRGRINNNSYVGSYNYSPASTYGIASVDLNTQGDLYYQQHSLQQIAYNAFKKPVSIYEEGKGRVDFEYGPFKNRTNAYYGGLSEEKSERRYHKMYSSITPIEITEDTETNTIKIVSYIGGDEYGAPIAYIKQEGVENLDEFYYLHRDYLGSLMAITDSEANVVERRQFGAWGETDKFVSNSGNTSFDYAALITRGYTGHEHFAEVGLIHMNGRMYDAHLGRFLSPDNFIQDPFSTQSYNRYGYVVNNPLSYTDKSGEIAFLVAIAAGAIIGAATAAVTYSIPAAITGNWNWNDFGTSVLYGAVGGAISGALSAVGTALFNSAVANGGTGAFWQSTTFNVLREVSSQVGTGLVFGNQVTTGMIAGAIVGGFVGSTFSPWSGIKGGVLENVLGEVAYESFKGAVRGSVAGGFGALIDGSNIGDGIANGARNGAIGGAVQSAAMIAVFGYTYNPSDKELESANKMGNATGISTSSVAWRKNGLYQFLQPRLAKLLTKGSKGVDRNFFERPVTWGNNVAIFASTESSVFGHEFGHFIQYTKQGWAEFQGKGIFEQLFMGQDPYSTPNTNEYEAEQMAHYYGGTCSAPGYCGVH